jgi:glycosyltransferase involved in cell wall biosynthesis
MPVPDGEWERGKGGGKAIQYSALAIVPVVSATGSGPEVVKHGVTGFVVNNTDLEWRNTLAQVLSRPLDWEQLGCNAREHVSRYYSVESQKNAYLALFDAGPSLPLAEAGTRLPKSPV